MSISFQSPFDKNLGVSSFSFLNLDLDPVYCSEYKKMFQPKVLYFIVSKSKINLMICGESISVSSVIK